MEKGWIKLYRQIFDCSIWSSREAFDKRSAWIDILLSASHKDVKMLVDGKTAIIPRGSFMFSIEKLSVRCPGIKSNAFLSCWKMNKW